MNSVSSIQKEYRPEDFGLQEDILPIMNTLEKIFSQLKMSPTHSEYKNVLNDIHLNIHTEQQLIHSLYGWIEGIDRNLLQSLEILSLLTEVIVQIQLYHGIDEVIMQS